MHIGLVLVIGVRLKLGWDRDRDIWPWYKYKLSGGKKKLFKYFSGRKISGKRFGVRISSEIFKTTQITFKNCDWKNKATSNIVSNENKWTKIMNWWVEG